MSAQHKRLVSDTWKRFSVFFYLRSKVLISVSYLGTRHLSLAGRSLGRYCGTLSVKPLRIEG